MSKKNNFKKGDKVKIIAMEKSIKDFYELGDICEVRGRDVDADGIDVWQTDKEDYWYFKPKELEKVEDV